MRSLDTGFIRANKKNRKKKKNREKDGRNRNKKREKEKKKKIRVTFSDFGFQNDKTAIVFRGEFTWVLISAERVPFWITPSDCSTENEDENKRFWYVTAR